MLNLEGFYEGIKMDNTELSGKAPDRQKYLFLAIGALLTIPVLIAGTLTLTGLITLAVLWMIGIFIYQRTKVLSGWSESSLPLKEYLYVQRQQKNNSSGRKVVTVPTTDLSLDDQHDTGMSPTEKTKWDSFVDQFEKEINDFDEVIKPFDSQKKRKPKNK